MRTDRELLELAAKAADEGIVFYGECWRAQTGREWNPLLDDGDALRLLVKLGMETYTNYDDEGQPEPFVGFLEAGKPIRYVNEAHGADPYAATRRAIVRVAAHIGANMTHPKQHTDGGANE